MTKTMIGLTCALALGLAGCAGGTPNAGAISPGAAERLASVKLDPAEAGRILNAYRASQGLGPVRLDPKLTAMAQRQANAMVAANSLSHDAGGSFTARIQASGLDTGRAAENLGGGYYSTQEAFAGWKQSSGHDANLRMAEATRFGIALAKDPRTSYGAWWALVLAADPGRSPKIAAGPMTGYWGSNPPR